MKIKKSRLREIVHGIVSEAAKEGHIQKIYKRQFTDMISKAASGGNKNTPPFTKKASKPGKSGPVTEQVNLLAEEQIEYSGILKINLGPRVISEVGALQSFLPEEARRLKDEDMHMTLLHQSILQPFADQAENMDYPVPPAIVLDDEVFERTSPGKKSWAVRVINQDEMREYVKHIMELLDSQNTNPEPERIFHVSLANLTGNPRDSVK